MVFVDTPYGLNIAKWDSAAPSLDETQSLIGRLSVLVRNKPWVYVSYIHPTMRPQPERLSGLVLGQDWPPERPRLQNDFHSFR